MKRPTLHCLPVLSGPDMSAANAPSSTLDGLPVTGMLTVCPGVNVRSMSGFTLAGIWASTQQELRSRSRPCSRGADLHACGVLIPVLCGDQGSGRLGGRRMGCRRARGVDWWSWRCGLLRCAFETWMSRSHCGL